jgi:hypothetical protein
MIRAHTDPERAFQQGYLAGLAILAGCFVLVIAFVGGTVWVLA